MNWDPFIREALAEDLGEGDHTSLSCIPESRRGRAELLIKDQGILAGVELARKIFLHLDSGVELEIFLPDGSITDYGQVAFKIEGNARVLLAAERLVLNCMQRMSGIATLTNAFVQRVNGTNAKILDTRKTTPLFRGVEKWAVEIGGGQNHRFGLFDMILIKDNHIDYCGGIKETLTAVRSYLQNNKLEIKIEIETRSLRDVEQVMKWGGADRIMFDNFHLDEIRRAVELINGHVETEASGGITLDTVRAVAETGVNFISVGALTHSFKSMDMSLNAVVT